MVSQVSIPTVQSFNPEGKVKILAVDCGIKYNIIRQLCDKGAHLTLVPYNHDISTEMASGKYDGLFLSNGPGDPRQCVETVAQLEKILAFTGDKVRPIFGICLGNQLLGLAGGAQIAKLPYGNR